MKKILLQVPSPSLANNKIFGESKTDYNLWREIKRQFFELGYELITADNNSIDDCDWIFFYESTGVDGLDTGHRGLKSQIKRFLGIKTPHNWPIRSLYQEAVRKGIKDKLVLFLWEGDVVIPQNYKKETLEKFDHVLTWNDDLVDNKKFLKFYWQIPPQTSPPIFPPFSQKKLLVNVSINRYSHHKDELYKERRKSINYFDSHIPNDFDLFGLKWNQPVTRIQRMFPWTVKKYKTYGGMIKDKIPVMSQYKFALCYENRKEINGYITEKIFDCFTAGTVPIYWGASNIEEYVDPSTFIDRRKFKSNASLALYIKEMREKDYNEMISAGQRYLVSDKFRMFLSETFSEEIVKKLETKKGKYS